MSHAGLAGLAGLACLACLACGRPQLTPAHTAGPDSSPMPTSRTLAPAEAEAALWPDFRAIAFLPSTAIERDAVASIVGALWRGVAEDAPEARTLAARALAAGLRLERWRIGPTTTWVLLEPADGRHGGGVYLVRPGAPPPGPSILLEAPHPFFDAESERIAARTFLADDAPAGLRGLFAATAHRYQVTPGDPRTPRGDSPADVAHAPEHVFSEATIAAARAGATLVVQLHGFDADARDAGDVVVSGGRAPAPAEAIAAAGALRALTPDVRLWPDDTAELGATTNVQGRLLAALDVAFVHLELAAPLRRRLAADPTARRLLGDALAAAAAAAPVAGGASPP